jgi:outer membrane beta-barrel protein
MIGFRQFTRAIAICALVLSQGAWATPKSVEIVSGKNYSIQNRFEVGVFVYDTSLRNVFVNHPYAAHLALGYHLFEWLQLQAVGGYVFSHGETSTLTQIRADLPLDFKGDLSLPQLWQRMWNLGLEAQWAPFYGKISLLSEAELNLQFYLLAGGALEGIQKVLNAKGDSQNATRFSVDVGLGLRLFLTERFAIRSEIKQAFGFNPALGDTSDVASTTWLQLGIGIFI